MKGDKIMHKKDKDSDSLSLYNARISHGSGFDLLRYSAFDDLLGEEKPQILYVLGKNMAREHRVTSIETAIEMFIQMGIGELTHVKEKRSEDIFELTSPLIEARHQAVKNHEYRFESGILAEVMTNCRGFQCETLEDIKPKKATVIFTVKHYR